MATLGERIRELREGKGWSQSELADAVGVKQQAVWKWETNQVSDIRKLRKIADALETSVTYLETGAEDMHEKSAKIATLQPRKSAIPSSIPRKKVPVYGPAAAGSPDIILLTDDFIIEYEDMPPELEDVRDGFRMQVSGSSMEPRHFDGERVSVHPYRKPSIGKDCIVVMEPEGNAIIKRFMGETETEWKLAQYNPPKSFSVKKKNVRAIYAVVR